MSTALLVCICVGQLAFSAAGRGAIIYAGPEWAAIDRGGSCEAVSRSVRIAPRGKLQAIAQFTFSADGRRWGEFHAQLRRLPRPGAAVMLRIDDQPFLLVSRGNSAWSSGPLEEQSIILALRSGHGMNVESRDLAGRRVIDSYSLDGAATAIDAAAAACAGKSASR